ncbi:class I mannose-6-phosphate isomerase [Fuchsiella alkaliacetigena]|nr:class I mannose-6-phosphate isomerase [Fuchsiella alkaliacetigena]
MQAVYKEKIWGGQALKEKFAKEIPNTSIGESWELMDDGQRSSRIINGELAGKELSEIIEKEASNILGSLVSRKDYPRFPLLIKFLDAKDRLSVQVHPDDEYAAKYEGGELGKTELWYIIEAQEGAKLICGLDSEVTKEEFKTAVEQGSLEEYLIELEVEAGDVVFIPAGTVHSIKEGILVAEIQQNSDLTYRIHDWERVDNDGQARELHLESALEAINFGQNWAGKVEGLTIEGEGFVRNILVACSSFIVESIELEDIYCGSTLETSFEVLLLLEGRGEIAYSLGKVEIEAGETVLLPAQMGDYQLRGDCKVLRSYLKDLEQLEVELKDKGYTVLELNKIAGYFQK